MNLSIYAADDLSAWLKEPSGRVIASFGQIIQDVIVMPVKGLSYGGGEVDGRITYYRGGCAANVAVGCAQMGIPARFIGHWGADATGDRLAAQLRSANVDVVGPGRGETASALSIATPEGDTALVLSPGSSRAMRVTDFDVKCLTDVGVLHLNSHHLYADDTRSVFYRLVELSREVGALISLDISAANRLEDYGIVRYRKDIARIHPEILMANTAEEAVLQIFNDYPQGAGMVIVHRGSESTCVLNEEGMLLSFPVTPVKNVVDTTGAGDAFASGFLAAGMRGNGLAASIATGHNLAAQVIVRPGAEYEIERTFSTFREIS